MSPFAAVAVKTVGAGAAAALLSMGVVSAATPSPSPSAATAGHAARPLVVKAVIDSEADVLGIKPEQLVKDLKAGQKVGDLAKAEGMTKEQFEAKLISALRPRLEALVDHKQITQARADRILHRIAGGWVPFWNGVHRSR